MPMEGSSVQSDRPVLDPGEIVCSPDGTFAFRIVEHIGEGRCCLVYSAKSIRDTTKVALKVYKRGPTYAGAIQREQYILDCLADPKNNLVMCYGTFTFNGLHIQVMELLEYNIRQLIFRNERQGLSPWLTQKFALDVLKAMNALHEHSFVHADLKPANIMWSSYDGSFKLLDFGLTFHLEEPDLHQVQSAGYKAPEAAEWNKHKDEEKRTRKRKLQGTYSDLTQTAPAYSDGLHRLEEKTALKMSDAAAEAPSSRLGGAAADTDDSNPQVQTTAAEQWRQPLAADSSAATVQDSSKNEDDDSAVTRWPSESSGIFTASSACHTPVTNSSSCITSHATSTPPCARRHLASNPVGNTSLASDNNVIDSGDLITATTTGSNVSFKTDSTFATNSCTSSVSSSIGGGSTPRRSCDDSSQEWRRGRTLIKKRGEAAVTRSPRPLSTCPSTASAAGADGGRREAGVRPRLPPPPPASPTEKVDMWSFGCLLVEAITGRKMFSASDKMATVLRPLQLLEMRIGETEIKYHDSAKLRFFQDAKDLIQKCLAESPGDRISAERALKHKFFSDHILTPSIKDMVLLPSNILKLLNVLDDDDNDQEIKDVLREVREEAAKYGAVTEVKAHNGHAFVEFQEASDCQRACAGLTGSTFDDKTVVAVFYPTQLWANKTLTV